MRLIARFLKKQGIETIGRNSNEESYIETVKTFYDKEKDKQKLKKKLIILENERLRSNGLSIVSEIGITISLLIAIITISVSILGQALNIKYNAMNNEISAKQQIENYENKIDDIANKEKGNDELKEYYNQKINEIKEKKNNNNITNTAKDDIDLYEKLLQNIYNIIGVFLFSAIVVAMLLKVRDKIIFDNKNVAINIHKSVIKERLLEIEKEDSLEENKNSKISMNGENLVYNISINLKDMNNIIVQKLEDELKEKQRQILDKIKK